jgi:hypothetical protein
MNSRLPRRARPHVTAGPARARALPARAVVRARTAHRPPPPAQPAPVRPLLRFTRHGIPALAVLAGVIAMAFGTTTSLVGGAGLIGAGIATWLVAWLYRVGVDGDSARDTEERARAEFERTGRWPDQ